MCRCIGMDITKSLATACRNDSSSPCTGIFKYMHVSMLALSHPSRSVYSTLHACYRCSHVPLPPPVCISPSVPRVFPLFFPRYISPSTPPPHQKLVRDAFDLAKEKSKDRGGAIIFIDELDAIGTKRYGGEKSGDSEVQRTMLELLNQLDGFNANTKIKVIAATNRPDVLDPALLR